MPRKADLPLHSDKKRKWDGPAAKGRMLDAATDGDGNISFEKAAQGFTYFIGERSDPKRGDFKSPFADIIDGTKKVVYRGVTAALSRNGSVKGISAEERAKGKRFLEGQRDRFPKDTEDLMQGVTVLKFEASEPKREKGRVLVSSGNRSRNRDFATGKPYRLVPAGMRTQYWQQNPLIFYMHNFLIPLGTGSEMYVEDGQLWMPDDIKFHRRKVPLFGWAVGDFDTGVIADLWDERVLNSVSIHVMLTPEDIENVAETDDEIIIPTSEVLEASIVTVPGDRDAQREDFEAELLQAMINKGVDEEMAKCVSCSPINTLTPFVPASASLKFGEQTANKGSFIDLSKDSEVSMSKNQVEETKEEVEVVEPTAEIEVTALEEVIEVEQEVEISVADFAEAIAHDGDALRTLALALVQEPLFIQELYEAIALVSPEVSQSEVLEAVPLRAKIVFTGSGHRSEIEEQVAQPVHRPIAVQQAAAAPVALPQSNGSPQKRTPNVLDLMRPSKK